MEMEYWILSQKWFKPRCESIRPEYSKQGTTNSHFNCDTTFHIIFHFLFRVFFESFRLRLLSPQCCRNDSVDISARIRKKKQKKVSLSPPQNLSTSKHELWINRQKGKKVIQNEIKCQPSSPAKKSLPRTREQISPSRKFWKKQKQNKTSGSVGVVCVSYFIYFVIDGK